jgi:guanine nucleotide-binding protein G(i) subunit alpha
MGACMSSNAEDGDQKKRSQMIDKRLEEDSKRLRRECKILLLGMWMKQLCGLMRD